MDEAKNDVDTTITPDSLNPPTWQGRALSWSGEARVPEPGEIVYAEVAEEETHEGTIFCLELGVVTGYFQAVLGGITGEQLEVTIDGVAQIARAGLVAIVPGNIRHSVKALTDGKAIIVDYPVRRDFA